MDNQTTRAIDNMPLHSNVKSIAVAFFQAYGQRSTKHFFNLTSEQVKEELMEMCSTVVIYEITIFKVSDSTNNFFAKPFEPESADTEKFHGNK